MEGLKNFYKENDYESNRMEKKYLRITKGKIVKETTKEKLSRINSKLTDKEVLEIFNLINEGKNYNIISEKYNISPSQITSIKQKTYKWLWI